MRHRRYLGVRRRGSARKRHGLVTRLTSHASGRLSGDQFCAYVANRLIIPTLDAADLQNFADGGITLDGLTRAYIHSHLEYQYMIVESSAEAVEVERQARSGTLFGTKPVLNPLSTKAPLSISPRQH